MTPETLDVLNEMIADLEKRIDNIDSLSATFVTPYDLLRLSYFLKSALTEVAQRTTASGQILPQEREGS